MATSCCSPLPIPCSQCDDIFQTNVTSCCPENNIMDLIDQGLTIAASKRNKSEDLISSKTFRRIENFISCVTTPLTFIVGAPSNMLCCLVFCRQGLKERVIVCLFSLALVELWCNIIWFIIGSSCLLSWLPFIPPFYIDWWKWHVLKYIRGAHRGLLSASGVLTMVITVERCICVVFPMKANKLISTRTMTILIVLIVVTLQLLCLVYPVKFDLMVVYNNVTGKREIKRYFTPFYYQNKKLIIFLQNFIIQGFITVMTFVTIIIATIITSIKLRKHMQGKQKKQIGISSSRSQVQLIKMLAVLAIFYSVTGFPAVVVAILQTTIPGFTVVGKYKRSFLASYLTYLQFNMLYTIVSFFVYLNRSSRFRSDLLHFMPSCCSKIIHISHSIGSTSAHETTQMYSIQPSHMTIASKSSQTVEGRLRFYSGQAYSQSFASSLSKGKSPLQVGRDNKREEKSRQNYKKKKLQALPPSVAISPALPRSFPAAGASEKEGDKSVSGDYPFPPISKLLDTHTDVDNLSSSTDRVSPKTEKGLKNDDKPSGVKSESSKKREPLKKEDTVTDTKSAAFLSKEVTVTADVKVTRAEEPAKSDALPSKAVTTDVKVAHAEEQAKSDALPSKAGTVTTDVKAAHAEQQVSSHSCSDSHHYQELLSGDTGWKCTIH